MAEPLTPDEDVARAPTPPLRKATSNSISPDFEGSVPLRTATSHSISSDAEEKVAMMDQQEALQRIVQGIERINISFGTIVKLIKEEADDDKEGDAESKYDSMDDDLDQVLSPPGRPTDPEAKSGHSSKRAVKNHHQPVVAEKDVTWKQFMNRFSLSEERHVIECLVSGSSLKEEMAAEELARARAKKARAKTLEGLFDASRQAFAANIMKNALEDTPDRPAEPFIHRVRLRAPAVIQKLKALINGGEDWDREALTFQRPFRMFVHFHQQMVNERDALRELPKNDGIKGRDLAGETEEPDSDQETDFESSQMSSSVSPLEQFELYVNFVEKRILPLESRFAPDRPPAELPSKVRYDDLWYLFKLGQIVYEPQRTRNTSSSTAQALWRISRIILPGDITYESRERGPVYCFKLICYYVDYNGKQYGAAPKTFNIYSYKDEKEVTSLCVYPLNYMEGHSSYMANARKNGKNFLDLISNKYGTYSGWTMVETPAGEDVFGPLSMHSGEIVLPEHIDSDVLIDFNEAFNYFPSWKTAFSAYGSQGVEASLGQDPDYKFYLWDDAKRIKAPKVIKDVMVLDDGVGTLQYNEFLKGNRAGVLEGGWEKFPEDDDDLLALLPNRLIVYAFWERKFAHVDSRLVKKIESDDSKNPFDQLEIEPQHRKMIQSVVSEHFLMKKVEERHRDASALISQDVIGNKGKGVVILLHGVPGVGKTATAEAIAHKWKRPLFPITCGDLGITAEAVEKSLSDIFRLANLWGCVLLLDEADVFIAKRDNKDISRNSLVSGEYRAVNVRRMLAP